MQQQTGPFHMPQEIMPQSRAFAGPFHQAGNIRHHKIQIMMAHHAQVGGEGGKMVIGDLGPRSSDHGQNGAFAARADRLCGCQGPGAETQASAAAQARTAEGAWLSGTCAGQRGADQRSIKDYWR